MEDEPKRKRMRISTHERGQELDEDEAMDEVDCSQVQLSPAPSQDVSRAARELTNYGSTIDDGVIEKILLTDFMCHKKLEVSLNSCVNFILGQNGSGKSAIMTAIIVALGGKATSTQRAHSLKDLIRTGSNQAEIQLTLSNKGSESFKPDQYGERIVVVRTIRKDGASSYKLQSSGGKVISQHKDDLLSMLDHFNIQVDNPVCMLSQDTSRNFLHSSNPGDKFKLFMKGTHLEKIKLDFTAVQEQQSLMKQEIERKIKMLPELQAKAKHYEQELQDIENLKNMESTEQQLSLEMLWATVKECEDKVTKTEKELQKEEKKMGNIQKKLDGYKEIEKSKQEKKEEASNILKDITKDIDAASVKKNDLIGQKVALDREVTKKLNDKRTLQQTMDRWKNEKKEFEAKLEEKRNKNPDDIRSQREELMRRASEIDAGVSHIMEKIQTAQKDLEAKGVAVEKARKEKSVIRSRVSEVDKDFKECRDSLERLSSSNDPLSGFGQYMIEIVNTIKRNQGRFSQLPKGPIGAYVKVKEQKWCFAIEMSIGFGTLCGFVVTSHDDEHKLKEIIRDICKRHRRNFIPPCFTSRFTGRPYDVSHNVPRCQFPVLLDMISVSDPDVFNILVDMSSLDSVLLVERKDEARRLMDHPPRNARTAYTKEGDQVLHDQYYSNKSRPYGILHASKADSLAQQQKCLDQLNSTMQGLSAQEAAITRNLDNLEKELQSIKKYIPTAQARKRDFVQSKANITREIEALDDANQEADMLTWEGEINELEDKITSQQDKIQQVQDSIREKREKLRELEEEKRVHSEYEQEVFDKLDSAKNKLRKVTDALQQTAVHVNEWNNRKQQMHMKIDNINTTLEKERKDVEEVIMIASSRCDRIETGRTPSSIKSEIDNIQRKLEQESHRRQNQEQVRVNFVESISKFNELDKAITNEKRSLESLKTSFQRRLVRYDEIQQRIARRACLYFQAIVHKRGYSGTLDFDGPNRRLEIIVKVSKDQATKNVRSLSGGERSFSTVAFIIALWEAMECPFRCLDEFDVFMDLMNRKISMQLMLDMGQSMKGKQFIFLTPQDMSSLGIKFPSNCSKIHLSPPDRNQGTLD